MAKARGQLQNISWFHGLKEPISRRANREEVWWYLFEAFQDVWRLL